MTVNLTRIYTRLGDGGETHLGDMSRVAKTHPRIEAYGTIDELNSYVGVVLALPDLPQTLRPWLERVQNDLFDVGADIAAPEDPEHERLRVIPEQIEWLEQRCDEVNATLAPLTVVRAARRHADGLAPARRSHRLPPCGTARRRLRPRGQCRGRAATSTACQTCCSSSLVARTPATSRYGSPADFA